MAKKIPSENVTDIELAPITKGMILEDVVSYKVSPEDAATWLENASDDSLGYITTRRQFKRRTPASGISITAPTKAVITNQLSGTNGDYVQLYFQQGRDLLQQRLVTSASGTIYSNFFTTTQKNRFDVIQKTLVMTNVGTGTFYHTGNSSTPSALDTEFPTSADLIAAGFVGRVWGAVSTGTVANVYYSDVIPAGGITSLSTAAQQFIQINSRNEVPTALIQTPNVLYVFTNNYIFRVFNTNSVENAPYYNFGTVSQESVTKTQDGFYFYHYSGIYFLSNAGAVKKISNPIYYLLKQVSPENQKNVFAWSQDIFVYFYLGQLNGQQANKYYTVRYNVMNDSWSLVTTKDALLVGTSTDLSEFATAETDTGEQWMPANIIMTATQMATLDIFDKDTDNQDCYGDFKDSGSPTDNINIDVQTKWITFDIEAHWKRVNGVAIPHVNASGITVSVQTDTDDPDRWTPVGTLDENSVTLFREFQSTAFNRIKFRYTGTSKGARVKFAMPILLQVDDLGYESQ